MKGFKVVKMNKLESINKKMEDIKKVTISNFKEFLLDNNIIDLFISSLHYELLNETNNIQEKEKIEKEIEKVLNDFLNKEE